MMNYQANDFLLGIDLGGTHIKAVLMDKDFHILDSHLTQTDDQDQTDVSERWKNSIRNLVDSFQQKTNHQIRKIGFSAPGLANEHNTAIASLPNRLAGLEHFLWSEWLGTPTYVLNDAHAALIAESKLGAGKGYQHIILLTLGTGVGGGMMINGKLIQNQYNRAGHFGHLSISDDPRQSIVGAPGSLEYAIGDYSVGTRSYGRYDSTHNLVNDYQAGNPFASWVWLNSVEKLARGINSLINAFSPEIVILGGGISKAGEALLGPLKDFLGIYEWETGGFRTPIVLAESGSDAGAVGAGIFASYM